MSKPLLGILLGAVLGFFDGMTAWFTPEVREQMVLIVASSTFKGLVAGIVIGFVAQRVNSLPLGILIGLIVAILVTLPFALMEDPATGNTYFWEIMLPGALVGTIVGYATQRYGIPKQSA